MARSRLAAARPLAARPLAAAAACPRGPCSFRATTRTPTCLPSTRTNAPPHHPCTCQAYAAAQTALVAGDEAEARACLERRAGLREQLTRAQGERADAFGRVTRMESAVAMLTERSRSIEAAMSRAVAVSAESRCVSRNLSRYISEATVLLSLTTNVLT